MPTFRKKTTIEAVQWHGGGYAFRQTIIELAGDDVMFRADREMRIRTREGWSDWLPLGYWIATDGKSCWAVADDFMRENYEEVEG